MLHTSSSGPQQWEQGHILPGNEGLRRLVPQVDNVYQSVVSEESHVDLNFADKLEI